jgi:hypothetical protein
LSKYPDFYTDFRSEGKFKRINAQKEDNTLTTFIKKTKVPGKNSFWIKVFGAPFLKYPFRYLSKGHTILDFLTPLLTYFEKDFLLL